MGRLFGTQAGDVQAASGRGIGKCCYAVGAEVAAMFETQGPEGRGSAHIDLAGENRRQLEEVGVTPGRIYASNLCTMCRPEQFHSFRRDREAAGRMHSFIGIR
jgi:copper oxidase (laccase) domain-containing protein